MSLYLSKIDIKVNQSSVDRLLLTMPATKITATSINDIETIGPILTPKNVNRKTKPATDVSPAMFPFVNGSLFPLIWKNVKQITDKNRAMTALMQADKNVLVNTNRGVSISPNINVLP